MTEILPEDIQVGDKIQIESKIHALIAKGEITDIVACDLPSCNYSECHELILCFKRPELDWCGMSHRHYYLLSKSSHSINKVTEVK